MQLLQNIFVFLVLSVAHPYNYCSISKGGNSTPKDISN